MCVQCVLLHRINGQDERIKAFEMNFKAHSNLVLLLPVLPFAASAMTAYIKHVKQSAESSSIGMALAEQQQWKNRKKRERKNRLLLFLKQSSRLPLCQPLLYKIRLTNKRFSSWTIFVLYSNKQKKNKFFYPTDLLFHCLVSRLICLCCWSQYEKKNWSKSKAGKNCCRSLHYWSFAFVAHHPVKKSSSSSSMLLSSGSIRKHAKNYSSYVRSFVYSLRLRCKADVARSRSSCVHIHIERWKWNGLGYETLTRSATREMLCFECVFIWEKNA